MKTFKRILSLLIIFIFTMFVSLVGIPADAVGKSAVVKKQITSATAYVIKAEKFVATSHFAVKEAQALASSAQIQVNKVATYGTKYKKTYDSLAKRLNSTKSKINTRIKELASNAAKMAKAAKAANAAVIKAEYIINSSKAKLATSDTVFKYAQNAFLAAQAAVAKLDSKSSEYKSFLPRVNAIKGKIQKVITARNAVAQAKKDEAAAEWAVKAVESAPLATLADVSSVMNLGNTAGVAIAKVTDAKKAANFTARLKAVTDRASALKTYLETAAKPISVSAIDGSITVVLDKKPITAVTTADFRIIKLINNGAQTAVVISSVSSINDTTYKLLVPTVAPIANIDQWIIYTVQYASNVAVNAAAYVIPKIPYITVTSITPLNLKQVKVTFNKAVNKISAETISNYLDNSTPLTTYYAKAELQPDNMSVIITYANAKAQQTATSMTVRSVSNDTLTETMVSQTFSLSSTDTTLPTVSSITASGYTSITINFSEPVNGANNISSYLIDGNSLSVYGATSASYNDMFTPSKQNAVTITFTSRLSSGTHIFSILGSRIYDAASLYLPASNNNIEFTIDTAKPSVVSVNTVGLTTMDITFNKPVSLPSIYSIYVNGVQLNNLASIYYKDGSTKTVVEITKSGLLTNGTNILYMAKSTVTDLNGSTNDTSDISISFNSSGYTTATVTNAYAVDNRTIIITFSNIMSTTATYSAYYSIRSSLGYAVSTISSVTQAYGQSYSYYINLASALSSGTYTLSVSGMTDIYGNTLYPYVTSITVGGDTTAPLAPTAVLIDDVYKKVQVNFSEPMDYSSIITKSDYQISLAGNGSYAPLGSSVSITPASDYRSVVLDFPDTTAIVAGTSALMTTALMDVSGNYTSAITNYGITIGVSLTSAKAGLLAQINVATSKLSSATEGTAYNQYPYPAKANFQTAITAANSVYSSATTLSQITNARTALSSAESIFDAAKVTIQGTGVTRTMQSVPGVAPADGINAVARLTISSGVTPATPETDTLEITNGVSATATSYTLGINFNDGMTPTAIIYATQATLVAGDTSVDVARKIYGALFANCPNIFSSYDVAYNNSKITFTSHVGLIPATSLITIIDSGSSGVGNLSSTETIPGHVSSGDIVLKLDNAPYTIPIAETDLTPNDVAAKIRAKSISGYTLGGSDNSIVIVKNTVGPMTSDFTGGFGVTGNIVSTINGANASSGAAQVNTVTITTPTGGAKSGTMSISVTDGTINKVVSVQVAAGDNAAVVAGKICTQMKADVAITGAYIVTTSSANIIFTRTAAAAPQTFGFVIQ